MHLNDLLTFAFCPLYRATPPSPASDSLEFHLQQLLLSLYSRELERGYKVSWEEVVQLWNRQWWKKRELEDTRAREQSNRALWSLNQFHRFYQEDSRLPLAVSFPYHLEIQHRYLQGELDLILILPQPQRNLSLVLLGEAQSLAALSRSLTLRLGALLVQRLYGEPPYSLESWYFAVNGRFQRLTLYPDTHYMQKASLIFHSLLRGLEEKHFYPNPLACPHCPQADHCHL